ncbi:MAG: ATP-binding cassette domain-containing protein [Myxococcota bacterium]
MTEPLVVARGIRKTFIDPGPWPWSPHREVHALRGVDLVLAPGEVVALVGQSGSGKTTLARCILGTEQPSAGEISVLGFAWDRLDAAAETTLQRQVQYIPQDALSALDPQQTVLEHIVESVTVVGGRPAAEARVEAQQLLDSLGIGHRASALPRDLSGGEQRRVTLARVLCLQPRIIVADEPTSGLDPRRRDEVLEDLIDARPEGTGVIWVTHDLGLAARFADRALVMLEGEVVERVELPDGKPSHPYATMLFDPWSVADESEPGETP